MKVVQYDGSFEGFVTAIFEVYEYKINDANICKEGHANDSLFGDTHFVHTNKEKATRVLNKLKQKISHRAFVNVYKTFLSELPGIENNLLRYVQYAIACNLTIESDYTNADVLLVHQTSHKVNREKHRMEAFVRFQLTKDQLYYSIIQPDYNVLPLISDHFEERYADQRWLIYDALRKYGLYYNMENVEEVTLNFRESETQQSDCIYDEQESLYQSLWQQYLTSVNISARKNMKLHIQHMPKRYWKYLVEKQPHK